MLRSGFNIGGHRAKACRRVGAVALALVIGLSAALPQGGMALAQGYGNGAAQADGGAPTSAYVDQLKWSIKFCQALRQPAYAVDCLAERLSYVAALMPQGGDRAAMRATLAAASRQLGAVAEKYASASQRPSYFSTTGARAAQTTRALRPVGAENAAPALAAANAIVEEAAVVLLRSSATSRDRAVDFQQIAAVIGSTKVLLRSS